MDYDEEKKDWFNIKTKHSAKIPSLLNNIKEKQEIIDDSKFRRKYTSKLGESINNYNKKEKFYNKFVNSIKKQNKKLVIEEEGNNKFINIVNKMMSEIITKNDDIRLSMNTPLNKTSKELKRFPTFDLNKDNDYINNIILIQRKYKDYKNKEIEYDELINKEKEYLSIKEIKNKSKEELEIELMKYIGRIKELFDIIKFYKNKINFIQFNIAFLKNKYSKRTKENIFQIEKQQSIYINKINNISPIINNNPNNNFSIYKKNSNNIKKNNNINDSINNNTNNNGLCNINYSQKMKKKISNVKDIKKSLKTPKNNSLNKSTRNKRVTIIDIKDPNYLINIVKDEEKKAKNNIDIDINNDTKNINNEIITKENRDILNNKENTNININNNKGDDMITITREVEENEEENKARLKKANNLRRLLQKKK